MATPPVSSPVHRDDVATSPLALPITPSSPVTREDAIKVLARHFGPQIKAAAPPNIVEWAHKRYYIPETSYPIQLQPCQRTILNLAMHSDYGFITFLYSTIKKSGKTAMAGLVSRYTAEFSGPKAEVYAVANAKEQAKDRSYESAVTSIELDPRYNALKRTLPNEWRIIERQAVHLPTDSIMRAIASDYGSAAGGNPTLTTWTELWNFTLESFKRLWDELTPVPTRKRSMRLVETYAGFEDESELLFDLYKLGLKGRRATHKELEQFASPAGSDPWPYADKDNIPIWINENARMITYWDTAVEPTNYARRMPWQQGKDGEAYYREQRTALRPEAFERLHGNLWQNSINEFIPVAWYQACKREVPVPKPEDYPMVLGVDASVSGDCTAIVGVSRHPDTLVAKPGDISRHDTDVLTRVCQVWYPKDMGGTIDYAEVEAAIREVCKKYNVVQISYDMYQLHDMMQRLTRSGVAWCKQFSQASDREIADKQLYDIIRDRKLWHNNEIEDVYISNAAAYTAGAGTKIERMRIVKKAKDRPVDPVVALSMATSECLRLML